MFWRVKVQTQTLTILIVVNCSLKMIPDFKQQISELERQKQDLESRLKEQTEKMEGNRTILVLLLETPASRKFMGSHGIGALSCGLWCQAGSTGVKG